LLEVKPGVWFIEGENGGRYPYAHSLYLRGAVNILIDTGAGSKLEALKEKTDKVLLTHYHRDHVTLNPIFSKPSFAIHKKDAPGVESIEGFYQLSGLDQVDIEAYWKMVRQSGFVNTKITNYLEDGDMIENGRITIKTLHLPGHTAGHCGFLIEEYELIFSADIDLTSFGPWYGNTTSDPDQFRESIRRLRSLNPKMLITGHSKPTSRKISEKLTAYESVLDQRDQKIVDELKIKPSTTAQLALRKIIYRRHNSQDALLFFEKSMIEKHIKSLINRGILEEAEGKYYVK